MVKDIGYFGFKKDRKNVAGNDRDNPNPKGLVSFNDPV
jgi:hypothetical protein